MVWNLLPKPRKTNLLKRPADARWWGLGLSEWLGYPMRPWTFPESGIPICRHTNGTFRLWDPVTLEPGPVHPEPKFMEQAAGLALSHDGKRFAFATKAGSVVIWDVPEEACFAELPWVPSENAMVAFSPDSKMVAAAAAGKELTVWDISERRRIASLPKSESMPIQGMLHFAPDNQTLAVVNVDGMGEVWNLQRKERVRYWSTGAKVTGAPPFSALSPDGSTLAVALDSNASLRLWNLATGQERLLAQTLTSCLALAFSPDGQRIAGGSNDGSIWIWNLQTFQQVARFQAHNGRGRADLWVVGLAFLPDGNTLISSTSETVRVWHAPSWAEIEKGR